MNKTHNINFPILGKFALSIYFHTPQVKYKKLGYISIFLHAKKHNVLQIKEVPEGKQFGRGCMAPQRFIPFDTRRTKWSSGVSDCGYAPHF